MGKKRFTMTLSYLEGAALPLFRLVKDAIEAEEQARRTEKESEKENEKEKVTQKEIDKEIEKEKDTLS